MANREHVDLVMQGFGAVNRWHSENPGKSLDLSGANLQKIDLEGAYLRRANLEAADLHSAHFGLTHGRDSTVLYEANLRGATISLADFRGADLRKVDGRNAVCTETHFFSARLDDADFGDASMVRTNLQGASLLRTNLSGTNLAFTIFAGTRLSGTNFKNAQFQGVHLSGIDLTEAVGLEHVRHLGPSLIGTDVLYQSQGKIPEPFLRGCGVPDVWIAYIPSLVEEPIQFYSVFISYSHADKAFAQRLHDTLQRCGIRCWLDEHQLLPGDDIYEHVDRGIRLWDKVLLCASKNSLTSWWVDNEITTAFDKEQRLMKERGKKVHALIPLNLDNFLSSDEWKSGYREQIRRRLAADFRNWTIDHDKFEVEVERLIRALQLRDCGRDAPPTPRL